MSNPQKIHSLEHLYQIFSIASDEEIKAVLSADAMKEIYDEYYQDFFCALVRSAMSESDVFTGYLRSPKSPKSPRNPINPSHSESTRKGVTL